MHGGQLSREEIDLLTTLCGQAEDELAGNHDKDLHALYTDPESQADLTNWFSKYLELQDSSRESIRKEITAYGNSFAPSVLDSLYHIDAIIAYTETGLKEEISAKGMPVLFGKNAQPANLNPNSADLVRSGTSIPVVWLLPDNRSEEQLRAASLPRLMEWQKQTRELIRNRYLLSIYKSNRALSEKIVDLTFKFGDEAGWVRTAIVDYCAAMLSDHMLGNGTTAKALDFYYPASGYRDYVGKLQRMPFDGSNSTASPALQLHAKRDAAFTLLYASNKIGSSRVRRYLVTVRKSSAKHPITTAEFLAGSRAQFKQDLASFSPYWAPTP